MSSHKSSFFWVLLNEKKQLIEYVEFPKGVKPEKAKPHRPRWAQRQTGARVRLYLPFKMWRCTLTCALYKSGQRKTKVAGEKSKWVPEKKTVWAWAETKYEAEDLARDKMDEIAIEHSGDLWSEWNADPSVAFDQIEYDEKLIGTVAVGK